MQVLRTQSAGATLVEVEVALVGLEGLVEDGARGLFLEDVLAAEQVIHGLEFTPAQRAEEIVVAVA